MAIINSYPNDKNIQDKDAWIGTDSYNRQTRQYTAEAVAKYLNIKGKISIGGQMNYQFVNTPKTASGTMALVNGGGDGTPFSAIQELTISINDLEGQTVVAFMNYLVGEEILISDQADIQNFGHYRIGSYSVDPINSNFYSLTLSYLDGNGVVTTDGYYDIVNFTLATSSAGDKTFVWPQPVAAPIWTVIHDLDKFPSVTMVLSTGQVGNGDLTYINSTKLTITFAGDESGKAYLN